MSLDDIWDEPTASPSKSTSVNDASSPIKRTRQSLFLSDSDSDYERPPKRATPAAREPRPDIEALFQDLDKDGDTGMGDIVEEEDLRYKPLPPALDLANLAREAEARRARGKHSGAPALTPHQILSSSSPPPEDFGGDGVDKPAGDTGKGKGGDGERKEKKKPAKLDEARLVGPEGFPQLIKDTKGFKAKGKGYEHADLKRMLQVYHFWTHKMHPKMPFKETVDRVEKLCHSKRMQVRLSVWRDEAKGLVNGRKLDDDPDVIDLTDPTLIGTEDDGMNGKETEHNQSKTDRAPSRTPSLPPSSDAEYDDFDIEAEIRAEEERRVAAQHATMSGSGSAQTLRSSPTPEPPAKVLYRENPGTNAMDIDEAELWDAFNDPQPPFNPPQSMTPSAAPDDDEDMWDIVNELEGGGQSKPAKKQIPILISSVVITPSSETTNSGNISRATNDDDWDEMYS
ncbi:Swi3-domain-containing protein [Paxillus ammoniavirescens]|nr:Swi3-domain-containing protein [Paxillus ammoniavirescens]